MTYRAPVGEMRFLLEHVLDAGRLAETERFAEATPETVEAVLAEAAKLAEDVLAPLRRAGDLEGARLENGVVRTTPGFADAYGTLAAGGWVGIAADPAHGGMGLPATVRHLRGRDVRGRQPRALALPDAGPGADRGAGAPRAGGGEGGLPAEAGGGGLDGDDEPDRAAGRLRRRRGADAAPSRSGDGTYAVSGQKIFISWGDHDMAENVCHLVLARLPDGAPGTKGISLFLVPKFLPDAEGRPGGRNARAGDLAGAQDGAARQPHLRDGVRRRHRAG